MSSEKKGQSVLALAVGPHHREIDLERAGKSLVYSRPRRHQSVAQLGVLRIH
jgi:hypothetical protein